MKATAKNISLSERNEYRITARATYEKEIAAVKFDADKPRPELLPSDALMEVAKVMAFGAKKYDDENWRKGFEWTRLLGSCHRHLHAWNAGENKDPESGLSHLSHAACNILFLLEHELKGLGKDTRHKYE